MAPVQRRAPGSVRRRPTPVPPATCLTKEYLPNGAVLFKDICTNEAAIQPARTGGPDTN